MMLKSLDIQFVKKHKTASIVIAYFLIGIIYVFTGYLHAIIIERDIVFHPFVGIILSWSWPVWVCATLRHTGETPSVIVVFAVLILFALIFANSWVKNIHYHH